MSVPSLHFYDAASVPESYFALRSQVYQEDLEINLAADRDVFDGYSDLLAVCDGSVVIGGARLTISSQSAIPLLQNGIELDTYFDQAELWQLGFCEISRLFIAKAYRSRQLLRRVVHALTLRKLDYGAYYTIALQPAAQARLYTRVCRSLQCETDIIRPVPVDPQGPYGHLGELSLVKVAPPLNAQFSARLAGRAASWQGQRPMPALSS